MATDVMHRCGRQKGSLNALSRIKEYIGRIVYFKEVWMFDMIAP